MSLTTRMGGTVIALALASAATPALAQVPGMPLFTNPRMSTGIRIHADMGQPLSDDATGGADLRVIQVGAGVVLGPLGINATVGSLKTTFDAADGCVESPTIACADSRITASLLGQFKIAGGGSQNLSLSLFGGASMDLDTAEISGSTPQFRELHIPVGVAIGLRVPLGMASLNLWGAPRWNMTRYTACEGPCPDTPKGNFGWAVGAELPIFRVLSVRAAYDSQKFEGATEALNVVGVGVSIGLGGMR